MQGALAGHGDSNVNIMINSSAPLIGIVLLRSNTPVTTPELTNQCEGTHSSFITASYSIGEV